MIPTYNERENIAELVRRVRLIYPDLRILFVDDASPDGTAEEIECLAGQDKNIILMKRAAKAGLGSAYRDAFRLILQEAPPAFVVTMDADLSHAPEDLARLIAALDGRDLVIGSRYVAGGKTENWGWRRRLLSRCGNRYASLLTGQKPRDLTSGFNAYATSHLRQIDLGAVASDGYAFQIEIKQKLIAAGARYTEIPITFRERAGGRSKLSKKIIFEGIGYPLGNFYERKKRGVWAAAIFLCSMLLYAGSAPHTIFTNDNAEFVTAAAVAGVPHPSGYPLFVLLSWLFSKLPLGLIAYRVNLLAAVFAAASLVMVYFLLMRLSKRLDPDQPLPPAAAAALTLPLAATQMFWFQAIVAKTYTLNLFLVLMAVYLVDRYLETRRPRSLYALAPVAGLGLSNHLIFALIFPFLGVLLIRRRVWTVKNFFICLGMFCLGLVPYLYIPLRAAAHPPLNWGNATSWPAFWHFVTRSQYNDLGASSFFDKFQYLASFFLNVWGQFGWLLLLAVAGLIWIFKSSKRHFYVLSAIMLANVLGIVILRDAGFNYANSEFSAPYYLPAYAAIYIFIASGAWFAARFLKKYAAVAAAAGFLALAFFFVLANRPANDMHGFSFIDDLSRQTLASLPKDAVFIVNTGNIAGDTVLFSYMFQQYANGLRPDVAVVGLPDVFPQPDRPAALAAYAIVPAAGRRRALYDYAVKNYPGRPIYATFALAANGLPRANGYVYALKDGTPATTKVLDISRRDKEILEQDLFGQQYLANYYYARAAYKLQNKDEAGALAEIGMAIAEDPMPGSQQLVDYQNFRALILPKPKK